MRVSGRAGAGDGAVKVPDPGEGQWARRAAERRRWHRRGHGGAAPGRGDGPASRRRARSDTGEASDGRSVLAESEQGDAVAAMGSRERDRAWGECVLPRARAPARRCACEGVAVGAAGSW